MVSISFESLCWPAGLQVVGERCARNKTLYCYTSTGEGSVV
jgi:hypothetical protein